MTSVLRETENLQLKLSYCSILDNTRSEPQSVRFIRKHISKNPDLTEESFYVVDLGIVKKRVHQWNCELPRVKPYYAVKCNPNIEITNLLRDMGTGFDCASKQEIKTMLDSGVSPSEIIFANPCKMPTHIRYAKEQGINLCTFDNMEELEKIKKVNPGAQLVLRILTDDSHSVCRFGAKFGSPPHHIQALLRRSIELDLNVVGVSFHVGSGCLSTSSFVEAVERAYNTFLEAEAMGIKMTLLDIGGGFPGFDGVGPTFADIAAALRDVLDELFPEESGIKIIAEPGRFFVAESHTLATCIYARRDIDLSDYQIPDPHETSSTKKKLPITSSNELTVVSKLGRRSRSNSASPLTHLYYVSDGVYSSFNCLFFDHAEVVPKMINPKPGPVYRATIFGPTCDSLDCIAKDVLLPKLEVNDWFYFENMGAYTISAASMFNGFSKANIHFIDSSL